jgi:hypothetical protein
MPDSISSCGVLNAPPARMTSFAAAAARAVAHDGHAGCPCLRHIDALDQRVGKYTQVVPAQHRVQERARVGQPRAVALVQLVGAVAVLRRAVEVVVAAVARFHRGIDEGARQRVQRCWQLHVELAADAVVSPHPCAGSRGACRRRARLA